MSDEQMIAEYFKGKEHYGMAFIQGCWMAFEEALDLLVTTPDKETTDKDKHSIPG